MIVVALSECLHLNNMAQKHPPTEGKRKVIGLNSSKEKIIRKGLLTIKVVNRETDCLGSVQFFTT